MLNFNYNIKVMATVVFSKITDRRLYDANTEKKKQNSFCFVTCIQYIMHHIT